MKGWKTWLAVAGMFFLGIVDICDGQVEGGITKVVGALGMFGIGHKVEKKKTEDPTSSRQRDYGAASSGKIRDEEIAI